MPNNNTPPIWDYGYWHADGAWVSLLGLIVCGHPECQAYDTSDTLPDWTPCGVADDLDGGATHWRKMARRVVREQR